MIKLSILMARKKGSSYEDFLRHWSTVHASVISSQPASRAFIRRYVQSHRLDEGAAASTSTFDGIAEVWFETIEHAAAFFASADYQKNVIPDEEMFLDRERCETLYSEEHGVTV